MGMRERVVRRHDDEVARLSSTERIELALRLGDDDVALMAAGQDISESEARERLRARSAEGRRPLRRLE